MRLILYVQYYRARSEERQAEIDRCLCSNLQHPQLDALVLLREPDAPPLPGPARMPVEQREAAERLSYAAWMRMLRQESDAIGILINADIALGKGVELLPSVLNSPDSALALSRYNAQPDGRAPRLNRFPHWTQDTWALRSDAPVSDSLLYASAFPIGYPGCDNRFAYVLWSHGLQVKNPCYFIETLHHQADHNRTYHKNNDRLYGGVSYVHPSLQLTEPSELEHTLWTRAREVCAGVLVNQKAVQEGVTRLQIGDAALARLFQDQQKSTGLSWSHPPLGCSRSDHASAWPLQRLLSHEGVTLELSSDRPLRGLQLRLPRLPDHRSWWLELAGQLQAGAHWQRLELGAAAELASDGRRHFLELPVLQQPWQRLRLQLRTEHLQDSPPEGLLELLTFAEPAARALAVSERPFRLQLHSRRLESLAALEGQGWRELHRYNNRFVLQERDGRIAFVDRFWPSAVSFEDPQLDAWDSQLLREAFVWGFAGPVLEWKDQQFSSEKLYPEQLHFWQYPCRTEQDAFERHKRLQEPCWDGEGIHLYLGLPWATWIDKKIFPEQLLDVCCSRIEAMQAILQESLHVHSVCQHIRWKEHPHRFEQAGVNHLWLAHKEKGWDREGSLQLHAWPLYAVNVLDPARCEGLEFLPVERKTTFAAFKGAHMKHYPTEIRLWLKDLAQNEGYEIEILEKWHFNSFVYDFQVANKEACSDMIQRDDMLAYNRLLSHSLFSLCPGGSGPNTLRLWESLAIGAIPVVMSDRLEMPCLEQGSGGPGDWEQAVIFLPETKESVAALDRTLRCIERDRLVSMQRCGVQIFEHFRTTTCFDALMH